MANRLAGLALFRAVPTSRGSQSCSIVVLHRQLAEDALNSGDFRKARKHFRIAIGIDRTQPAALIGLARAWELDPHGNHERAFSWYRQAAILCRNDPLLNARLARAAARLGKRKLALAAIARSARIAPANADSLEVIRQAFMVLGKPQRALRLVQKARFINPNNKNLQALWQRAQFDFIFRKQNQRKSQACRVLPFLRIVHQTRGVKPRWEGPAVIKADFR